MLAVYISAKELYIPAKEPYIPAKKPHDKARIDEALSFRDFFCFGCWARLWHILVGFFCAKQPEYLQRSPILELDITRCYDLEKFVLATAGDGGGTAL